MQFCEECDNMLYFQIVNTDDKKENDEIQSSEKLIYLCKCCGNEHVNIKQLQHSVYSVNYNTDNIKKQSVINKYTHYDNTLPKTIGIKCPNEKCPSKTPNIIYINYDEVNMKYIYMCLDCQKNNIEPNVW